MIISLSFTAILLPGKEVYQTIDAQSVLFVITVLIYAFEFIFD